MKYFVQHPKSMWRGIIYILQFIYIKKSHACFHFSCIAAVVACNFAELDFRVVYTENLAAINFFVTIVDLTLSYIDAYQWNVYWYSWFL